uniref:Uncharacterized protein n=1 Tax=Brassica campestris TaxID=3711 RepID=M4DME5_BRACM
MFGLGFVGNVGHGLGFVGIVGHFWYGGLDKFIKLKLRYVPKSTRFVAQWQPKWQWMDGWMDGFSFKKKKWQWMLLHTGFIGNITTSTSVSPTSSAPLVFAAAGTLSLSIPVVDLKCKSSVDGLPDSCLQLSDAKGSNRFANLAMLEEDI